MSVRASTEPSCHEPSPPTSSSRSRTGKLYPRASPALEAHVQQVFESPRTPYLTLMVLLVVSLGGLGLGLAWLGQHWYGTSMYYFRDLIGSVGPAQGAMTALSSFLMVVASSLLVSVGDVAGARRTWKRRVWQLAGLGMFWLACDDTLMIHEALAERLIHHGVPRLFGMEQDMYIFLIYALGAGVTGLLTFNTVLRVRSAWPMLVGMVGFAFLSESLDGIPWDGLTHHQQQWLGPLEELCKVEAALCGALYAYVLHRELQRERLFRLLSELEARGQIRL